MRTIVGMVWFTVLIPAVVVGQQRQFGAATFSVPDGFTVDSRPTMQTFSRVRGRELCMIAVYQAEDSPPALDAAFTSAWTGVFRENMYRRIDRPAVREAVSPAGYRHAVGDGTMEDRAGNPFVARLHVFPVGARTQAIVLMGNSQGALDGCRAEWDTFLTSLRFPGVAVAAAPTGGREGASRPAEPPPATTGAVASGEPEHFENVTFAAPAGWRVQRAANGVTLVPGRTLPGEALQVMLLPGRPFSGTLASQFAPAWNEVIAMFGATPMRTVNGSAYDLDEPGRSLRGWEYLHGNGGMITDNGRRRWDADLYLIRAGDRLERVLVVSSEFRVNLMTLHADQNPVHERAIRRFIFSLEFANQPSRALPAATLGKSTSGVWGGSAMSFGQYKATFAVLFDDGTAFFGPSLPTQGLDGIDPSVEQPRGPRYWGTYRMSGTSGEIRVPPGPVPMRVDGTVLEVNPLGTVHRFARIAPPDTRQVEGTWCLEDGACLQLGPGGRFRDTGAARVLEHSTYDYPESPTGGQGTYEVRNYSLILRYDSGQEMRFVCLGVVSGELWLSFNLDALTKR